MMEVSAAILNFVNVINVSVQEKVATSNIYSNACGT